VKSIIISDSGVEYNVSITNRVSDITEDWKAFAAKSIYAELAYVSLLEDHGPIGFDYYYATIRKNNKVSGAFYFQHKTIHLSEDFRIHTHSKNVFAKLRVAFLKNLFKLVKHEFLVCGNVLLTGEYGYTYTEKLSHEFCDELIKEVISYIREKTNRKIKTILLKDFYQDNRISSVEMLGRDYTEVVVQPDMIFNVEERWSEFDDYLTEVKSKYRVKFKKVKKKAKDLDLMIMNQEQADKYNEQMYALYKSTADRALFSLFTLDQNYFKELKRSLGDRLILTGVFNGDKMLGFFTYVQNGEYGDAHFLGYDVKENSRYQLYFNILLRLIKEAINGKVKYLNLSRTALEIKSSVGAIPYDMNIYVKHTNPWVNKLLPFILSKTVPQNDWVPRSPFSSDK
jgi:predicted N-acyltransferase